MKYLPIKLTLLIILFESGFCLAQSADQNHIISKQYTVPRIASDASMAPQNMNASIQYFDGFGKPVQQIEIGFGPAGQDLVRANQYDDLERLTKDYLPYPVEGSNNGAFNFNNVVDQAEFYSNHLGITGNPYAYSEYSYRPDPTNFMSYEVGPGEEWQQYGIAHSYKPSSQTGIVHFKIGSDGYPSKAGTYNGDIWESKTINEELSATITYTNKFKKTILIRKQIGAAQWADTYYVYDNFQRLRFVLPPECTASVDLDIPSDYTILRSDYTITSSTGKYMYMPGVNVRISPEIRLSPELIIKSYGLSSGHLDLWAFQYKYDNKGRVIAKKLPGAEWIYFVYDSRDRLIMTQDGNLRKNGQWLFTKYDIMNREILTGITVDIEDPDRIRDEASKANPATLFEFRDNSTIGYSNRTYPIVSSDDEYLTVNYYDDYLFPHASETDFQYLARLGNNHHFMGVNGILTGKKFKNLNTGAWINSASYYDDRFNKIQTITKNQVDGVLDRTSVAYNFVGNILKTNTELQTVSESHNLYRIYSYDNRQRLIKMEHRIDSGPLVVLFENEYNFLGEVIDKKLYSEDGVNFDQSLDYDYNIRGYLTKINDSNLSDGENDLWGMELAYANLMPGVNESTQLLKYDGNISAIKYSDSGDGQVTQRGNQYQYDRLGRIKAASHRKYTGFWSNTNAFSVSQIEYDNNGNILHLNRNDAAGSVMDNISYAYDGNQLLSVTDAGNATEGFIDGNVSGHDYEYDVNGNMIADYNKDVASITYNHLNLPKKVVKDDGQFLVFQYDAVGIKIAKEVFSASNQLQKRTDYIGEFIYETDASGNTELALIQHEEGRIVADKTSGNFEYQYHLKDHLGNTRVTFTTKPKTIVFKANYENDPNNVDDLELFEDVQIATIRDFNHTTGTYTNGTAYNHSQILRSSPHNQIGSAIAIPVGAGDKVTASVFAKYFAAAEDPNVMATSLASALASAFTGTSGAANTEAGIGTINNNFGTGSVIGGSGFPYEDANAPKAFLNLMFLPDGNAIDLVKDASFAYDQITNGSTESVIDGVSTSPFDELRIEDFVAPQNGFILVYLSNEGSLTDVYFDDMEIKIEEHPVIQKDDYYPFGLTFNSWQRTTAKENSFKFQEQEHIDDLSLNWDSFKWRNHQPEIGRFFNIDPLAESYYYNSPYAFSENRVLNGIELEGLEHIGIYLMQKYLEISIKMAPFKSAISEGVNNISSGKTTYMAPEASEHISSDNKTITDVTRTSAEIEKVGEAVGGVIKTGVSESALMTAEVAQVTGDAIQVAGIVVGNPVVAGTGATISAGGLALEVATNTISKGNVSLSDATKVAIAAVAGKLGGLAQEAIKKGDLGTKAGQMTEIIIKAHEEGAQKVQKENEQN